MIGPKLKAEFLGEIIDIFEDFLTEKCVVLPNSDDSDPDANAIIKGDDYYHLEEEIESLLNEWGVRAKESDSVSTALEHYEIIREDEKHEQL